MTDTLTYDLLTPQDEYNIVSNNLRQAESTHYALTVSQMGLTTANTNASTQLDGLVTQIEALQTEYERVKALVEAATPDAAPST